MQKSHFLRSSFLGLAASLGAASAAHAEMNTYACHFDPAEPASLTVNYDTATGQFALVDYYGSSGLPAGVQVSAFSANGPVLEFSLGVYNGANLQQTDNYRYEFIRQSATLDRETASGDTAHFVATCAENGQTMDAVPTAPPAAAPPLTQVAMPHFYGGLYQAEVQAAVQQSNLAPVTGTPTSGIEPPSNTICTSVYGSNDIFIEAGWCASTQLDSSSFEYGGILGFISPDTEYGRKPAWCTDMGGYRNFGEGHSIELKYWLPRNPAGISGLVIRSGTGIPEISPYLHSKPRVLRVEAPDMSWTWNLQSTTEFQAITFAQPIHSDWVRVVIEDAYMGDTWSNICVSDLFAVFEP